MYTDNHNLLLGFITANAGGNLSLVFPAASFSEVACDDL
jgi:hypothetical protein